MEDCAACGKPIGPGDSSYYHRNPEEDFGKCYHVGCGELPAHSDLMWRPIESAPKDGSRILGFGVLALESENGIGTVKWESWCHNWVCDPHEATEYGPERCVLTHWMPLPEPPSASV